MDPAASHQRSSQPEFLPGTTLKNTTSRNGTGSSTHPTLIQRSPAGVNAPAQPWRLPWPYHSRPNSRPGSFASLFTKNGRGRSPSLLLAVLSNFSRPSQGELLTSSISILQQSTARTSSSSSFPHPLPHLLWQAAPPGERKSHPFLHRTCHILLTKDSSWIFPAGTRPPVLAQHTHWLSPHTPVLSVAFSHCPRAWEKQVQISPQGRQGFFPQKNQFTCVIPLGLEARAPFCL